MPLLVRESQPSLMMSMVFNDAQTHRCEPERGHGVYPGQSQESRTNYQKPWAFKGFTTRRRCITTRRKPGHRVMPDLLDRKFTASAPNRVDVGDITYLPCKGGKNMYLATVIDAYSRKLAGYALAGHMRVSLVIDALAHAHGVRGSGDGAI
ncbi:DDE-type integrase/transposase/recombinase [Corynebacterium macginleyi]|nr:DDE-type integrase/transposase/recombinase [Corynebacterium macginleyi]